MRIDLVVIPYNDFLKGQALGFRDRDLHLISELVKDDRVKRVVVVERPRSILTLFKLKKLSVGGAEKIFDNLKRLSEKVYLFEYFSFGIEQVFEKHLWFDKIYGSKNFVGKFLTALEHLEISDFALLSFNPFAQKLVDSLNPRFFFFDAIDNLCLHPSLKNLYDYLCHVYFKISDRARLIFCVNENVKRFFEERFPSLKDRIIILHNGVCEMNFHAEEPNDLSGIKRPMIGYVGVISERIDFELVEYLAQNRSDYSFVFVGPFYGDVGRWVKRLKRLKNVFFLGERHYNEISDYIASFDVCVIPHIVDEFTLSNDPMKVYEYIYAGKPVISTGIYINRELLDFVFVANEREGFLECLDKAVKVSRDDSFILRQRGGIKKWMFWSERAKFMLDKILAVIQLGELEGDRFTG